jgi:hypothetical protein
VSENLADRIRATVRATTVVQRKSCLQHEFGRPNYQTRGHQPMIVVTMPPAGVTCCLSSEIERGPDKLTPDISR